MLQDEVTTQERMRSSPGPQFPPDGKVGGPPVTTLPLIQAQSPTLLFPSDAGLWMLGGIFPSLVWKRFTFVFVSLTSRPDEKAERAIPTHWPLVTGICRPENEILPFGGAKKFCPGLCACNSPGQSGLNGDRPSGHEV